MKKGTLVSVYTVFSILLCCAGIFYLLCTTDPDGDASDPQAAGSVQDTALTDGGLSDENGSDDRASSRSDSGDTGSDVGNASDNMEAADHADATDHAEAVDKEASDKNASSDGEAAPDGKSDDPASDDNEVSDVDAMLPEKGVFYSVRKFRKRFPDTDPKLLVGKIVNIDKKETVHLRRTTSKNAYLNGRLRLGDKVSILKLGRDWVKVKKGKKTGYIYYKYIAVAVK